MFGEKLRFACKIEILYEDGTMQEIGRGAELMPVGQHLTYILKDGKQTYKPLFLISGYRYVLLKNWPEKVQKENFKSIAAEVPEKTEADLYMPDGTIYRNVASGRYECKMKD